MLQEYLQKLRFLILESKKQVSDYLANCFYNIRSIVNKLSSFQALIYSHDYDIIAITETWLSNNIFDNLLTIPYTVMTVAQEVEEFFSHTVQDNIISKVLPTPTDIEMLTVKVEASQKIIISVVYLPPNPSLLSIQSLLSHLSQFPKPCNAVLLGNFNLSDINWDTLYGNSKVAETFFDVCFESNLSHIFMVTQ